ncbi:MAG: hypothetical protein HY815_18795 [Candidatus Riflebacteria bacterium]|nr:hypothetical protein [Candidatus Riflebacteria bacterium]
MDPEKCPKCDAAVGFDEVICRGCGAAIKRQRLLGEILVDEGMISRDRLEEALRLQKRRLGEILVEIGACKAEDLDRAVQLQRLGRTRADIYRRQLRFALVVILMLVLGLAFALLRLERDAELLLKLEKETLGVDEVAAIISDPRSFHKFDALRSLAHFLEDPRAIKILDQALRSDSWYVQLYAAHLARRTRDRSLVGALVPLLIDERGLVGPVAHQALQAVTGAKLEPSVKAWREWAAVNGVGLDGKRP